jgi:quercetin dioxygenase-like cupin family protein
MTEIIFVADRLKYLSVMKYLEIIEKLRLGEPIHAEKDIETRQIYKGSRRQILEITLSNQAILSKHQASEPITVFCLAGKGRFRAGPEMSEEIVLEIGMLLTLEAETLHEVIAEPALKLLVTKFKQD